MKIITMLALVIITVILFSVRYDFHDEPGKWVFAGGLWLILLIPLIGAGALFMYAFKIHDGGEKDLKPKGAGGGFYDTGTKTPIYKIGFFQFGVVITLITICIWIYQNSQA